MANCLKTQLKSPVANGNLRKLDEFTINYSSAGNTTLIIEYASGSGYSMADIRSNGVTFVLASGNASATVSGTGKVFVPNRDLVSSIIIRNASGGVSFDDTLYYVSSVKAFYLNDTSVDFNLALLSGCNLIQDLRLYNNSHITGDVSQLLHLKDVLQTALNLNYCTEVTGSMADLGKFKNLGNIELHYTQVGGDLIDFVHSRREPEGPNQSTGSVTIRPSAYVKFSGSDVSSGVHTLSWTATTISLDGGEPITA